MISNTSKTIYNHKLILEKFPNREDVFEVTKEQEDKMSRMHKRVKSNFYIRGDEGDYSYSNLTRVNQLPRNYTLRKEYVRCGKQKANKCKSCPHGPYYYGYWREKHTDQKKSIIGKKYLGTIDPRL